MSRRSGFTLVELVVVVMILGILAAVAVPKLVNTTGTATDNGLRQTLAVVRDAIEVYAANNGGNLPGATTLKDDLKPYLRGNFPTSPVGTTKNASVTSTTGATMTADNSTDWMYNSGDGRFIANCDKDSKTADPSDSTKMLKYSEF